VSVTQRDPAPLALGQRVLVIAGAQARIVPDYVVPALPPPEPPAAPAATPEPLAVP
jgi:outer membrane lipoprotein SlyB